jgi:hypothetical protein
MKGQPRYLIAKYVPEVLRNEPRNFGVIVWTPFKVDARFWGESLGNVDGRKVPDWIRSKTAYKEWVKFLRNCVVKGEISTKGETITSETPEFLSALENVSGANYLLGDSGLIPESIEASDVPILTDYLYELLVAGETDPQTAKNAYELEVACNKVIRRTRVNEDQRFKRNRSVICSIAKGVTEYIHFDYYYGNGDPEWLYKRVPLGIRQLDRFVDSTAWQFDRVVRASVIPREKGAALIMPTDEQRAEPSVQEAIRVLGTVTRVIDIGENAQQLQTELDSLPETDCI